MSKDDLILYKYRPLDNWKFVLDIVVNSRLYAAPFQSLNDPMEGRYYDFGAAVTQGFRKAIFKSKLRRNICSLSQTTGNTLLWSYYAAGHTGVAFGVKVQTRNPQQNLELRQVRYDSGIYIGEDMVKRDPDVVALDILTQKQLPWQHEQEVRIFAAEPFVRVMLKELVLGCSIARTDEALITTVARRWHPRLTIRKLDHSSLDHPVALAAPAR